MLRVPRGIGNVFLCIFYVCCIYRYRRALYYIVYIIYNKKNKKKLYVTWNIFHSFINFYSFWYICWTKEDPRIAIFKTTFFYEERLTNHRRRAVCFTCAQKSIFFFVFREESFVVWYNTIYILYIIMPFGFYFFGNRTSWWFFCINISIFKYNYIYFIFVVNNNLFFTMLY